MSNPDYSNYNNFVKTMQDLQPCLLKILQNRFNRDMASETYGTPTTPKDGQLLKYTMEEGDEEQTISPLSIMVECIGNLYKAMHNLGLFANRIELGRAMQTRVNLFLTNKEWDASHILDFKTEGPIEQHHPIKIETPVQAKAPLELVSMVVMGPLHGATKFTYVLIIHDAYSSMIWVQGLMNKSQASQEVVWWFSEICVTTHQTPSEVIFNHRLKEVHIDQVMNGTTLVASGQQLHSADGILLEPLSLNEAKLCDDWDKWQKAMINEMTSMNKMDVFELAEILPDGKLIGVLWVFKLKLDAQ
ncbi:uncharacterized protein UBRO2_05972 [Ustilago bromivora]|uniref:Reverse transcriptase Ty1/copia-type domain-containing protein n=1 Tax=Ustilago bromivora TaxID=307758 RepID=A0A8H8QSG8_9BASI|nr:uncharacterized protein UBRO2_05972 [Ustilago bromivora]